MKIYILGLGVGESALSLRASGLLTGKKAAAVIVKTRHHDAYKLFEGTTHTTCDDLYESSADFDALNKAIAERVASASKDREVLYFVPGSGAGDTSVELLRQIGGDIEFVLAAGLETEAAAAYCGGAYTVTSASRLLLLENIDTDIALIVTETDDAALAGDVKLKLGEFYGDDTPVVILPQKNTVPLFEVDRQKKYGHLTVLVILPTPLLTKQRFGFTDLVQIMHLLAGEGGCPWDRVQTHTSIRQNMLEEAYEAIDAIDSGDSENLVEELGDVLLQAVFHCIIAEKREDFGCSDMLDRLCEKLIFRHPHVFGTQDRAGNAAEALTSWEGAKTVEKSEPKLSDKLNRLPPSFPQTLRAQKVGKKCRKAGIGSDVTTEDNLDILSENIQKLSDGRVDKAVADTKNAVKTGASALPDSVADIEQIVGECLYALALVAATADIDLEIALKKTVDGYVGRVAEIEKILVSRDTPLEHASKEDIYAAIAQLLYAGGEKKNK